MVAPHRPRPESGPYRGNFSRLRASEGQPATPWPEPSALRRAADETQSPVQCGQALWDAVEFLTAGVRVPKAFGKADRRAISAALQEVHLTEKQRTRLDDTLQRLNEPSLAMKMWVRAAADGVPLATSEIDLLQRLRAARNDSAHGRAPSAVSEHDLR